MKKKRKNKSVSHNAVAKGKIEIVRSGTGFVAVEGLERDVLIRPENLKQALNGDTVRIEIFDAHKISKRTEGAVLEVLQRKQNEFIGRLQVSKNFAFLIPDNEQVPVDIFIPLHLLHDGKDGDAAAVKIVEWPAKSKNPVGEVISILTGASANEVAMQEILSDGGFPLQFPEEVLEEAARIPEQISAGEIAGRWDYRDVLTITIDPVDAKDFDDAISVKVLRGGNLEVGVHIADVSHYMKEGTALDEEAFARATSVYLPDRVIPMLPERLSNELCSLRPNEDKWVFSVIFKISKQGQIKDYKIGRAIINSDRRYTYEEVQAVIEGGADQYQKELLLLNELSQSLRAARFKKGAINFSSSEVRFLLDENAKPVGVVVKESKESHQLIEELMLLANRTVAEYVSQFTYKDKPLPFPYRVHDVPNEDKLKIFSMFASRFGHKFNLNDPKSIAESFNEMLELVKGRPEQHVLESLGIRTMSKAVYTTENIGHYGLGFDNYCHFTSPIRRYPDVLVHRIVQQCLDGVISPVKKLEEKCKHCSEMERRAMEAERLANKYKQVEFMLDHVGEDFDAVISGISSFGFWAETVLHKCEGMVSINELMLVDYFQHIEEEYALVGKETGIKFRIGDRVRVRLVSANLERRQIDFTLEEMPQQQVSKKSRSGEAAKKSTGKASKKRKN